MHGLCDDACCQASSQSLLHQCAAVLQAWAELEAGEGHWLRAVKLLEQALAADQQHLPSWMVSGANAVAGAVNCLQLNWGTNGDIQAATAPCNSGVSRSQQ